MTILISVAALAVVTWLAIRAICTFRATEGGLADKLAAAWKGSLTVFVLAWGAIITISVNGLDTLSQITGDPDFAQLADTLKSALPPSVVPYVPPAIMAVGIAARLTHNPPRK